MQQIAFDKKKSFIFFPPGSFLEHDEDYQKEGRKKSHFPLFSNWEKVSDFKTMMRNMSFELCVLTHVAHCYLSLKPQVNVREEAARNFSNHMVNFDSKTRVRTQEIIRNLILGFELFFFGEWLWLIVVELTQGVSMFSSFFLSLFLLFFWGSLKWNLFHEATRSDHVLKIDCFNMTIRKARKIVGEEKLIPILVFFEGKVLWISC